MSKKREVIIHRFYTADTNIWVSEWYEPLSAEKLEKMAVEVAEMGYGIPEYVTDTAGRLVILSRRNAQEDEGKQIDLLREI